MSDTSARLHLPYILPSQAQKHVTHNEAIRDLDGLVMASVLDRDLATPPVGPAEGDGYIVAAPATDDWAGAEGNLAIWRDGAWGLYPPQVGWRVWVADEATLVVYDGSTWGGITENLEMLGINTSADLTNRLAVSAPATLLTHDGDDHQLKVNKAAATDTASLLFQTGFSGRAEMGLAGSDDFSFKVSADGSAFTQALTVEGATGHVGVGTDAPARALHVSGDTPFLRIEDNANSINTGSRAAIEYYDDTARTAAFGFNSASNKHFSLKVDDPGTDIRLQGGVTLAITGGGNVGIGTNAPSTTLDVEGDIECTTLSETSDRRLKQGIAPAGAAGNLIDQMQVVAYDWADGSGHVPFGLVAQDLAQVLPAAVVHGDAGDEVTRKWAVSHGPLVALLIGEVQELRKRLATLEAE